MIKYIPASQLIFNGFSHPFALSLCSDTRWVKLATLILWDALICVYSKSLNSTHGRESIGVRMAIVAIIVKHKLSIDDRGIDAMISENMYLQYFCGLLSFHTQEPSHPEVFVDIRKRMGANVFDLWNALIIKKADDLKPTKKKMISDDDDYTKGLQKNKGTLKIDAIVANHKIVFPIDAGLLNIARKGTEYLVFSKKRRKSRKEVRKFIRKQLGFVKRNLTYIEKLLDHKESIRKQETLDGFLLIKNPYPSKFP